MLALGWVETDRDGLILACSEDAAGMLNCGRRTLVGRDLRLFFPEHSPALSAALEDVRVPGVSRSVEVSLRPMDRKPFGVTAQLVGTPGQKTVHWVLASHD